MGQKQNSGVADDGPYTMDHLLEITGEPFETLKLVLDKCPQFLQEYYNAVRNYEDGLRFCDFARDRIKSVGRAIPSDRFMRWDICLISLKLEMLDRLGRWEEYHEFFLDIYKKYPNYRGAYAKTANHLKLDRASPYFLGEDERYFYAHFLYLLLPRFESIGKVLKLRNKGIIRRAIPRLGRGETKKAFVDMSERLAFLLGLENNVIRKTQDDS